VEERYACTYEHEEALWVNGKAPVAGVDEAGRGPLAGPVVVAAVILPRGGEAGGWGLNDSKQLSEEDRERLYDLITTCAEAIWAVAVIGVEDIDTLNILRATHKGMAQSLASLHLAPKHALVDGLPVRGLPCEHTALVKGDSRSHSIAAASILAKVTRDRLMRQAHEEFPHYGFAQHKGYPTPGHLQALAAHGPCPLHRRSFAPVAQQEFKF
jgi:ribonuclease HII